MSEQDDAIERIRHYVWSGFYKPDEIAEIVCEEMFAPGTLNEDWVRGQISSEFERKHAEETSWGATTDCERLDMAFAELERRHVIALQNAGYTQSDGITDISEVWHEAGAEASDIIGYCFYHGQDLERVVRGEGLMVTFGDILGTDEKGVTIGRIIREVLEKYGLKVDWDGTIKNRINIPEICWRKRTRGG